MKFVAFGRSAIFANTISALIDAGHVATIIGTCRATPESSVNEKELQRLADGLSVSFFNDSRINSDTIARALADSDSDVAVSVNWPNIVGRKVCRLFPHGVLNAHAGDLPRYRGNATWAYAILNAERQMGVCIHQMEPDNLDSGPILLKEYVPITSETTVGNLVASCEMLIPRMFVQALDGLEKGTLQPTQQPSDPSISLRCFPRQMVDGLLRWDRTSDELARVVRASSEPYAGAYTFLNGEKLIIWEAESHDVAYPYVGVPGQVIRRDQESGAVWVLTGDGSLEVKQVSIRDLGREKPSEVIRSIRQRLGMDVEDEILALRKQVLELHETLLGHD